MAKALWEIRSVEDFSRGRHIFQISPLPPPPPTSNLTGRSTHIDLISSPLSTVKTGLGENDEFTFCTVRLLSERIFKYIMKDSNEN